MSKSSADKTPGEQEKWIINQRVQGTFTQRLEGVLKTADCSLRCPQAKTQFNFLVDDKRTKLNLNHPRYQSGTRKTEDEFPELKPFVVDVFICDTELPEDLLTFANELS